MADRVLTAPLAVIKVAGVPIGKMRTVRLNETFRRGRVIGIGNLTPDELPALEWSGTFSCEFFTVDFNKKSSLPNAIVRAVNTLQEFVDTVLLQDTGVDVDVLKKVAAGPPDPVTGIIPSQYVVVAQVKGLFLEREGMDITDANISGKNQEFSYLFPVLFKL